MNNSQGALYFGAGIDTAQWKRDIESMRRDILGLNNSVKNETKQMDSSFKNLSTGIAGYFSASALIGFTQQLINVRGEFQKTEIAFSTMLGDGGKATALMSQMVDLAAKTPFSLSEVANGAKQLLAFQIPADQVVDTLTRMGNIAAGLSVPLARINLVYGQVKAKGKLMGDDLRQFTEAGIPMVAELAKKFGKTTGEITTMVSAGKIGFKDVQDVLFNLTNEGGMFYNLMEKQSKSLSGKIANLGDSWGQMLNKIGESNEGLLSSGIEGLSYLIEHYEDVLKVLTILVSTYGAYRAALMFTAVIQKSIALATFVQEYFAMARALGFATANMIAFNSATLINPLAATVAVIALAVSSYMLYGDELKQVLGLTKELTNAQKAQQAVNEEFSSKFSKSLAQQKTDIQGLISIIRNEAATIKQREDAYKKLIAISPAFEGTLDKQFKATQKLGQAFAFVSAQLEKYAIAQAQMAVKTDKLKDYTEKSFDAGRLKTEVDDLVKLRNQLENKIASSVNAKGGFNLAIGGFKNKDEFNNARDQLSSIRGKISDLGEQWKEANNAAKAASYIYNGTNKEIKKTTDELQKQNIVLEAQLKGGKMNGVAFSADVRKKLEDQLASNKKTLSYYVGVTPESEITPEAKLNWKQGIEAQIKKLEEEMELPSTGKQRYFEIKKQIDDLNDLLNPKKEKKDNKQIAEFLPMGSIKELQQRAQLIQEAMDVAINSQVKLRKLDKYGKDKDKNGNPFLTGEVISTQSAYDQILIINDRIKELQIKSFDEQTAELERRIKIRDQIIQSGYSKEIADSMFPDLAGKDLLKSLQELQADINVKMSSGKGTKGDAENYAKISATIDTLLGKQSALDKFNSGTDKALSKIRNEADKLLYLKDLQSKLTDSEVSNGYYANLEDRIRNSVKQQEESYQDLLVEHQSFEEKRNEIADKASKERLKILEDESLTPEKKAQLTKSVTTESNQQISDVAVEEIEKSSAWMALYSGVQELTAYQMQVLIDELEKKAPELKKVMTPIDFSLMLKKLKETKARITEMNPFQGMFNAATGLLQTFNAETDETAEVTFIKFKSVSDSVKSLLQSTTGAVRMFDSIREYMSDSANDTMDTIEQVATFGMVMMEAIDTTVTAVKSALDNASWSNWITAIISIIYTVIKAVVSLFSWIGGNKKKKMEKEVKEWKSVLNDLENAYKDLEVAATKAYGAMKYDGQRQLIKNIEEQQKAIEEMKNAENKKKKADQDKINEWNNQQADNVRKMQEIRDGIIRDVLQTDIPDMASKLGDALVEAFGKGEDGMKAINDAFDDLIKNMLKNQLNLVLQGQLQPVIKKMLSAAGFNENGEGSFNGLTPQEIAEIRAMYEAAAANGQQFIQAYSDIFGELQGQSSSLTGAIKGMSEETAGILAGQMNAIRIMQGEALKVHQDSNNVLKSSLLQLTQIEINTRFLKLIYDGLKDKGILRGMGRV